VVTKILRGIALAYSAGARGDSRPRADRRLAAACQVMPGLVL